MATLAELADRRAHLRAKIEFIQDLLTYGYSPESQLKEQYGELVHDEVMVELDERWLDPIRLELSKLERLEIDDGTAKKAKGRQKAKRKK